MTMRLIHLWSGPDGQSHISAGAVPWARDEAASEIAAREAVTDIRFEESPAGTASDWHNAPCRQYAITLSGMLMFETRGGELETIRPGDILLLEDMTGGGHRWRLVDEAPWRRVCVTLA